MSAESKKKLFRLSETDRMLEVHWRSGSLKYRDFQLMDEGGIAKLYTCFDENLCRRVVYKTLHDHLKNSEIETQRFLREARVTANIAHPNTVPIYELGRDRSGSLFFTMKHVKGRDLRAIIIALRNGDKKTSELFPLPILIEILIQVCHAVVHAHQRGVIHRDLKPANILTGEFSETYVIDWGLAKVWGESELIELPISNNKASFSLTPSGRSYGTPLYTTPELIRGDSMVDGRVDVFCLGSVLFEILTHRQLLEGKTIDEIKDKLLNRPLPRPSQIAPEKEIPEPLENICCHSLAIEPGDRFDSVQALSSALQAYQVSTK